MKEMVGGCCVCSDDRGWPENPLVYCDGQSCTVAVHQACYGIVTVPTGPWYCRKCESQERAVKVKCELCPSKYGALKRTDNSGWAHVVCALYIPEVRFGNVTTMEPIQLQLIPAERFNKVCYICEENGKPANSSVGACMQCNKSGCKQQFHVTCAQGLGLLCEEAGNYLDNVKYCGYCQYHYSKLKKGGNVKTIPPYKPVSTENHLSDSNSEKEAETNIALNVTKTTGNAPSVSTSSSGKRKTSSGTKSTAASVKISSSGSKTSSTSHQRTNVHNSSTKSVDKQKSSTTAVVKGVKSGEDGTLIGVTESVSVEVKIDKTVKESKDLVEELPKVEVKEGKGKKRKANSRTPTPISGTPISNIPNPVGVDSGANTQTSVVDVNSGVGVVSNLEKSGNVSESDKVKKVKTDSSHHSAVVQQAGSLTSTTVLTKVSPPLQVIGDSVTIPSTVATATASQQSIIQSVLGQQVNSLVVSVPLHSTNLTPNATNIVHNHNSNSPQTTNFIHLPQERVVSPDAISSANTSNDSGVIGGTANQNIGMITSEMSGGGLKVTYEKHVPSNATLQMELERITPAPELPTKRSSYLRSQSSEKTEKTTRLKKRGSANSTNSANPNVNTGHVKRSGKSQQPPSESSQSTSFSFNQNKNSPPSSPSSESLEGAPSQNRKKGRKSAPASISGSSGSSKDTKDGKMFPNGIIVPHMMGNQLNPNSNMAQKMSDHLSSEIEAHSIFSPGETNNNLIGPQLHHKVIASTRSSSAGGSSTTSGGSGLSSMLGGVSGAIPQTLDQLLERQWEQGSQFLMEQAQHFDIASLLSCLHQLRAENLRLEEHVNSLLQRRDHLLAVNARLAIPLTGPPAAPQPAHPHTVNNIHPAVAATHGSEPSRSRHNSGYPTAHGQNIAAVPIENGLPPEQGYPHQHRSPAVPQPQPSPSQPVRHSPATVTYQGTTALMRQNADSSGRSAPRPQPYTHPPYQGSSATQPPVVVRRDADVHHQPSTKPS